MGSANNGKQSAVITQLATCEVKEVPTLCNTLMPRASAGDDRRHHNLRRSKEAFEESA